MHASALKLRVKVNRTCGGEESNPRMEEWTPKVRSTGHGVPVDHLGLVFLLEWCNISQ